jgi:asparagine synthase (glutamine-hydrolysing)
MCGIAGILNLAREPVPDLGHSLNVMSRLLRHRGPDGEGLWEHAKGHLGFTHRRLSVIDLATGDQPMTDESGNWIVYNGEIYNYLELRDEIGGDFVTNSDTEVVLKGYRKWGPDCVNHFRGMFAFALWDEEKQALFCARDRFGIKPFYYAIVNGVFYCASEIKALLPFLEQIETDLDGLKDYLAFQFCLAGKTLFRGVQELLPGHTLFISNGSLTTDRYWEVYFEPDFTHTSMYFEEKLRQLLVDSVGMHVRSDVPIGATLSGGLDSSAVSSLAIRAHEGPFVAFTGKFSFDERYDESRYARAMAEWAGFELLEIDIGVKDFIKNLEKVIYYLDYPVAGPGSFPQYMVSQLASQHRKVVLGGQGGDEIFGGYTRYLIAYFEQCIRGAIEGTMHSGKFIVTYESIIPNLTALRNYKPMLKEFWREGLFEEMDRRYFRLINRAPRLGDEIRWDMLGNYSPFDTFKTIFNGANVDKASYFDLMTHFDFKTQLPALLQVEDRMAGAHGIESRVPFLDHPLIELAATIPSDIKFKNGTMKHILKEVVRPFLPEMILNRQDKMGFPTPLTEWVQNGAREYVRDILSSAKAKERALIDNTKVLAGLDDESAFGRKLWGLLCLELWQQTFHDKQADFKRLLKD